MERKPPGLRSMSTSADIDGMRAATYAVRPGDTLRQQFPLSLFAEGQYAIDVHGPNGFYRSFRGNAASRHLHLHTEYEAIGTELSGNIRVNLRSTSSEPLTIEIQDNSYRTGKTTRNIAPEHTASILLPLKQSHGWYDFTVKQKFWN